MQMSLIYLKNGKMNLHMPGSLKGDPLQKTAGQFYLLQVKNLKIIIG